MEWFAAVVEGKRKNEARQAKNVVAMQVADEDVFDFVPGHPEIAHPHLRPFATVNEEMAVLNL